MVDFDMDCDKTENGWFELIGTDNQSNVLLNIDDTFDYNLFIYKYLFIYF